MNTTDETPVEDLAAVDSIDLYRRIEEAQAERDGQARHIATLVMADDPDEFLPYAKQGYAEAQAALDVLYAEARRRIEARKAVQ